MWRRFIYLALILVNVFDVEDLESILNTMNFIQCGVMIWIGCGFNSSPQNAFGQSLFCKLQLYQDLASVLWAIMGHQTPQNRHRCQRMIIIVHQVTLMCLSQLQVSKTR